MSSELVLSLERLMPAWPPHLGHTAVFALVLMLGAVCGEFFNRILCLPRITGYSVAGLLVGPALLNWVGPDQIDGMRLVIDLSLALMLFELGVRVDLGWLRRNPALLANSLAEASFSFLAAMAVLLALNYSFNVSLIVAIICISTSPAVVMRMTSELKASGQVSERLLVLTALNVAYAVIGAHLALGYLHQAHGGGWLTTLLHPVYLLAGSLAAAWLLSMAFGAIRRFFDLSADQASAVLFGVLLLTMALLREAKLPVLLTPLLAGMMVRRSDPRPHLWPRHFGSAGGLLVILFFVMTGAMLTWGNVVSGWLVAVALVAVRAAGKMLGTVPISLRSGLTLRQSLALGASLAPLSGVAFVLSDDIGNLYPELGIELRTIVMTMVAILELAGPFIVQQALKRADQTGETRHGT